MTTFETLLNIGLVVAGVTHFLTLIAGLQLPTRLNWAEEMPRLGRFNRKVVYVYYLFTGFTIILFGAMTLYMREEIMDKDPEASLLALVVGVWWLGRILVDAFVFDHDDWPEGKQFIIGHIVLTTGFVGMAAVMLTAGIRGLF